MRTALDRSKVETPTTFPPYKGIVIGENKNAAKAIPLMQKEDNALGIDGCIQKANEQINWTNTVVKGLEMNVAKSIEVKEQIDTVQVSINDVNRCLNNVQFESSMFRSYARDSLNKIEEVEEKLVEHLNTNK